MKQLVSALEAMITESEAATSETSQQREINHRMYSLQPIGNEIPGRSQYISPDVLDSVESKKALFAETFFSGRQVIRFMGEDKQESEKKTSYVEMQLDRNNVYQLFRDGWHDAFVAKKMTVVAEWLEDAEDVVVSLKNASQMAVMQIIQELASENGEIVNIDAAGLEQVGQDASGVLSSGDMTISFDRSRVDLTLVQPERCFRDPSATYVNEGQWFTYELEIARGDLIKRGVSEDQVEKLTTEYRFAQNDEDNARKAHDSSWTRRRQAKRADEQSLVTVYVTYAYLDMNDYGDEYETDSGEDGYGLYRIMWANGECLEDENGEMLIKEVTEMPVFEWTEFKISHSETGLADADLTSHTQKVQSTLKRLIIDNQQMRNTTRYEATVGSVKNPRELIDNNIGGTVWTQRPGSIVPLATPELSPLSLSVVQMLDADKDSRSGISALSKGMNMGAVTNQNASDMIERLTNAGQRRVIRAARDFAQTFMVPLCQYIYKLGVRNDQRTHNREVAGKYELIKPGSWPDMDVDMNISVALTPDERERHGQALLAIYQFQLQDPDLKLGFGYAQKHALLDDIYDSLGVSDSSSYLLRPDSPEYKQKQKFQAKQMQDHQQQQMAQAQQQQQMMQRQQQLEMDRYQFEQFLAKSKNDRDWNDLEISKAKAEVDARDTVADNIREDEKLSWEIAKGSAEISLEDSQKRAVSID